MSTEEGNLSAKEFGKQVYVESSSALAASGPTVMLNIGVAILAWLFGNLVFIPISQGLMLGQYAITQIISLIIFATMAIMIVSAIIHIRRLSNAVAGQLAYTIGVRKGEVTREELGHYRTALTGVVTVIIVALAFLLFSANLSIIHPSLTGIALIIVVIWTMFTLWRSGNALAAEIKVVAEELAEKVKERAG